MKTMRRIGILLGVLISGIYGITSIRECDRIAKRMRADHTLLKLASVQIVGGAKSSDPETLQLFETIISRSTPCWGDWVDHGYSSERPFYVDISPASCREFQILCSIGNLDRIIFEWSPFEPFLGPRHQYFCELKLNEIPKHLHPYFLPPKLQKKQE
ncbi:hypothetical protein [Tuwongella immobilis]|uniref:Uncharacterized protein n=1 Tax=Tuwongella immobilis TaxID=692036 RepID=A0A6C2YJU9_9BACT|nr:hypothetical protein [Tuwongella immobilis]VIP01385.1 unnamed protein product [Tuwongella immobilis]VTR98248.1 unnamed protein product [Tuwongella immobilis]